MLKSCHVKRAVSVMPCQPPNIMILKTK